MTTRGAGGTAGGLGQFFMGLALLALGAYLFLSHVMVTSNLNSMWNGHGGLLLLPLALGLALIFFSARSIVGWLITVGTIGLVLFEVISNLSLYFAPTGLVRTVAMLTAMVAGLLMVLRSLRAK